MGTEPFVGSTGMIAWNRHKIVGAAQQALRQPAS
jgi:hypothetical protein